MGWPRGRIAESLTVTAAALSFHLKELNFAKLVPVSARVPVVAGFMKCTLAQAEANSLRTVPASPCVDARNTSGTSTGASVPHLPIL